MGYEQCAEEIMWVTLGCRLIGEIMFPLGCNAALTASYLPTFRDNLSVQEPMSQDNLAYKVLFLENVQDTRIPLRNVKVNTLTETSCLQRRRIKHSARY